MCIRDSSTVMNAKIPMILDRNFQPGFKIDLHIKDLNNALETGHGVGAPLPLTANVMEMLQTLHQDVYKRQVVSYMAAMATSLTRNSTQLFVEMPTPSRDSSAR